MVVIEAAAVGVPSVVVRAEDNAATELVEEGVNGFVAPPRRRRTWPRRSRGRSRAAAALRRSTAAWFAANARRLSLASSLERVSQAYRV